jgi:hypothetical protein
MTTNMGDADMNAHQDYDDDQPGPLTGEGVHKHRNDLEILVGQIMIHYNQTFGIRLSDWPGDTLAEHNMLVRRCWKGLDRLQAWAGSSYGLNGDHPDRSRAQFIAACNQLFAEIEPGAHVAAVEIMLHNQDGTAVSYAIEAGNADIIRVVHAADHEGCIEITTTEES